jgi:hypothetical protein
MGKCNASLYNSLSWCEGQTVLPGIKPAVYFIPKRDIVKWPSLPGLDKAKSMAELATYEDNFELAADKTWLTLKALSTKSSVTTETQGEYPSVTSLNKVSLKYPGTDEEAAGFCRQAMADDLVFLVQQRNGKFRVIGSEQFESTTKPSQALGEGNTGEAGTTVEVEATDVCPAPFYPGEIVTEDGTISGLDGSEVETNVTEK